MRSSAQQRWQQRGILQRWCTMRKRIMPLRLWHTAAWYGHGQGRDEFVPPVPYRYSQTTEIGPPGLESHSKSLLRNSAQFLTEAGEEPLCGDDALRGH